MNIVLHPDQLEISNKILQQFNAKHQVEFEMMVGSGRLTIAFICGK